MLARVLGPAMVLGLLVSGCGGGGSSPAPVPCDQACQDEIALRSFRETLKLAFNLKIQGNPVGPQDASAMCPFGGGVHIFGSATSNASQGFTFVQLTYELSQCGYRQTDVDPLQTYDMVLTGTATENGTLSAQPTSTTALTIQSDSMTFAGTVHDPPLTYQGAGCALQLVQNGNQLSGLICGRQAGLTL
jgi:hypothetical protein